MIVYNYIYFIDIEILHLSTNHTMTWLKKSSILSIMRNILKIDKSVLSLMIFKSILIMSYNCTCFLSNFCIELILVLYGLCIENWINLYEICIFQRNSTCIYRSSVKMTVFLTASQCCIDIFYFAAWINVFPQIVNARFLFYLDYYFFFLEIRLH